MKLKYYMRGIGIGLVFSVILYSMVIIPKYKMTDEEIMERARQLGMNMQDNKDVDLSALTGTPQPTKEEEPAPTDTPTPEAPSRPDAPSHPEEPSSPPEPTTPDISEPSGQPNQTISNIPEPSGQPNQTGADISGPSGQPNQTGTDISGPFGQPNQTGADIPGPPGQSNQTGADISKPSDPSTIPAPTKAAVVDGKASITVVLGMNSDEFAELAQKVGLVDNAKDFDEYLMENGYAKELRAGTYLIPIGSTYQEIAERVTAR